MVQKQWPTKMNLKASGRFWYRKIVLLSIAALLALASWSLREVISFNSNMMRTSAKQSQSIDDIKSQLSSVPLLNEHLYKIDGEIKDNRFRICKLEHSKDKNYDCDVIYYNGSQK